MNSGDGWTGGGSAANVARLTVSEAGEPLIDHLDALGRKPTTIAVYRSIVRTHLAVQLADKTLDRIDVADVEGMVAAMRRQDTKPKTIGNALTLLGQVFDHGIRRGWCTRNPVRMVDRPTVEQSTEIRFLDQSELEALLRSSPPSDRPHPVPRRGDDRPEAGRTTEHSGGCDVDWPAGNDPRPPQLRPGPLVPHAEVADARAGRCRWPTGWSPSLSATSNRSLYQADDHLVFSATRRRANRLLLRLGGASTPPPLGVAAVRRIRFHDLRHVFATRMAVVGVPMRTLQEWLGHRDSQDRP